MLTAQLNQLKCSVPVICFPCFCLGVCWPNSYFLSLLLESKHDRQGLFLGDHDVQNRVGLVEGRTVLADRQMGGRINNVILTNKKDSPPQKDHDLLSFDKLTVSHWYHLVVRPLDSFPATAIIMITATAC